MKKLLNMTLLLTLVVVMLISTMAIPVSAAKEKTVNKAIQSVVRILSKTEDGAISTGTAFYVGKSEKGKDIFVTNRHVVTDDDFNHCSRIYILKDNSTSVKTTTYVYADSQNNILSSYTPADDLPTPFAEYGEIDIDTSRTISCDVLYTTYRCRYRFSLQQDRL